MLFFKDIVHDKLSDGDFKKLYDRECHICSITVKIVALLDKDPDQLTAVLKRTGMTRHQWQAFKSGDRCDPETVQVMYDVLGMDAQINMRNCPRL